LLTYVFFFFLGTIIGSFLNVCIYRLPRGESIVSPRSHCPHCQKIIRWFDNIPLFSFIFLRQRCRYCKGKISWRYFLVELITGIILAFLWAKFHYSWFFPAFFVFSAALVVISFVDLEFLLIPDIITYPGIALGLLVGSFYSSFLNSVLGCLIGGSFFFLLAHVGQFIFKREALGGGDIKLMAMIGAFLGVINGFVTIFLASLVGTVVGLTLIILKLKSRKDVIPFGPFLSLGALMTLFGGEAILRWWEKFNLIIFSKFVM